MAKLTDLGFSKGIIVETIVSTYNPDGTSNAAPMGVTMQDPQHLTMSIFNTSSTYRNLQTNKQGTINITRDIEIFYKTTFKDSQLPEEWFETAQTVNAPELRFADATVAFSVLQMEPIEEKTAVTCKVEQICAQESYPQVCCRAMSLTLEAIIHGTRVKAFINEEKKQKSVSELLVLIQNCNDVVNRVAPSSTYSLVMADLLKRIDSWRNKP
jgi:hypothetical protein